MTEDLEKIRAYRNAHIEQLQKACIKAAWEVADWIDETHAKHDAPPINRVKLATIIHKHIVKGEL